MESGKYISIYVRNSQDGPSCFYRLVQYQQFLAKLMPLKVNNALSTPSFHINMKIRKGLAKRFIQGVLYIEICFRRMFSLIQDLWRHPSILIIQREVFPRWIMPFSYMLLDKLLKRTITIWDFDDDIIADGEISTKEKELLLRNCSVVVATSEYLLDKLEKTDGKLIDLPTTDGFSYKYDINSIISEKKIDNNINIIWVGTDSGLKYLSGAIDYINTAGRVLEKENKRIILQIVCNKPFINNVNYNNITIENIQWSRETAENAILNAHIGIMPLEDSEHARGKGGFKLIQYLSAGIPVIASNVGFNKEVVDSECGYLVSSKEEWINAIYTLSTKGTEWKKKACHARERYLNCYDYKKTAQAWQQIIVDVLREP